MQPAAWGELRGPARRAQVYAWRHPADGTPALTLYAIGQRLGVSAERVRQLAARAERDRAIAER